jgi:hypothetical protein
MYFSSLQVVFHAAVTALVLIIAAIVTAGYVSTCQNLHQEVRYVLFYGYIYTMYFAVFIVNISLFHSLSLSLLQLCKKQKYSAKTCGIGTIWG